MCATLEQFLLDKLILVESTNHYEVVTETVRNWIDEFNSKALKNIEPVEIFDKARVSYPGTKNGKDTEFVNFKKKHKDWKTVLPILSDAIENQKKVRAIKIQRNEFVPPWKNFSTWINQRCWEEETPIEIIAPPTSDKKHAFGSLQEKLKRQQQNG